MYLVDLYITKSVIVYQIRKIGSIIIDLILYELIYSIYLHLVIYSSTYILYDKHLIRKRYFKIDTVNYFFQ